jgi:flagellar biosynthesis protein
MVFEKRRPERKKAVALRYDKDMETAPLVVAAGKGKVAEKILAAAGQHGVPVREEGDLAEALIRVGVGKEIPVELYRAVAEVLAFVYRLKQRTEGGGYKG